jgi:hypothetical protein
MSLHGQVTFFFEMPARNEPSWASYILFFKMPARNEPFMGKLRFFSKCRPVFRGGKKKKKPKIKKLKNAQ